MEKFVFMMLCLISCLLVSMGIYAQTKHTENDTLYSQIARMDSLLFTAFNKRDTATFKNLFSKDLEFYHDKGGLTDYEYTIAFMRSTAKTNNGLRRDLVPGSLEVYPIKDFGAIEIGSHRFCHNENGKQDCGTFKFLHIWKRFGEEWKITRVISYNH